MNAPKSTNTLPLPWHLYDEGKGVATFNPEVLATVRVKTSTGTEERVRIQLNFKDGQSEILDISLAELDRVDWFQKDKRCLLNPHYRKAKQFIANILRVGSNTAPMEERYRLERMGIHHIGNAIFFVAGDRIITRSSAYEEPVPEVELAPSPFRLDIDPNLTAKEAFEGMKRLMILSPEIGRILLAHVISGLTRAAFKEAGFTPCSILVIVGETGMLKSHYVPLITQLYNRSDRIGPNTRFNSTARFIEDILYDFSECTSAIDDLHTGKSKSIMRKNNETAEEIIRRLADDTGRGHKEGNASVQKDFRGNAGFIGEYAIGRESTVPRALVANITKPPDGRILDNFQRHQPLLVSTFYYSFLQWYVEHYEGIRDEIDERLTAFRQTKSHVHLRLRDTQFYLQTAYMFFLEFCKNSGFITAKEAQEEYSDFGYQLVELIQAQQARIRPDKEKPESVNYLKLIRKLYEAGNFRIADNVGEFYEDKHDGVIHYDCLCLRGEKLDKKIRKILPGFKRNDLTNALKRANAIKLVNQKHSVQIPGLHGLRFYAIPLDRIQ